MSTVRAGVVSQVGFQDSRVVSGEIDKSIQRSTEAKKEKPLNTLMLDALDGAIRV